MIRRKSSSDVSLIMLLVNGLGYTSGVGYVLVKNIDAFWLKFNYIAGLVMTIVCIIFWALFRKEV